MIITVHPRKGEKKKQTVPLKLWAFPVSLKQVNVVSASDHSGSCMLSTLTNYFCPVQSYYIPR